MGIINQLVAPALCEGCYSQNTVIKRHDIIPPANHGVTDINRVFDELSIIDETVLIFLFLSFQYEARDD